VTGVVHAPQGHTPTAQEGLWFGGDYNPEQWSEQTWAQDEALMRAAGVNTATVGVFSWALLEPAEGRYEFGWLDATLDRLAAAGVRAILATPTASPPPWFSLAHPDALPVTRDGTRLWHGSRDTYCAAAPAYRTAARRIAVALAERYSAHPALAMWHVHNEYGTLCWCQEHAAPAFRRWLAGRYGTGEAGLAALNAAWGTSVWGQVYSAWEQVSVPRATQWLANPCQQLDFRRFWSDELLAAFGEQRDAIRACSDAPVTTNFALAGHQVLDLRAWSREVDVVSVDHYLDTTTEDGHADIAFGADWARSLAHGRPWILMENATRLVYSGRRVLSREPGRMLRDSLGYVARGSDSVLFFQWRASRAGAEMYHSAMVPHAGPDTAAFAEVTTLGEAIGRIGEVAGSTVEAARAAVLLDAHSWWALDSRGLGLADVRYLDAVRRDHAALWRAGIACDLASPEDDLSRYGLVLAPSSYLLSAAGVQELRTYVHGGGRLVVSYLSGIVDDQYHVRLGGYPGGLREVLGIRVEEFYPLPDDAEVTLSSGDRGTAWSELLRPTTAEVLASYDDGPLAGRPAVTRNPFGRGTAWYVSTRLGDSAHERLIAGAAGEAGIAPGLRGQALGVDVVRRHGPAGQTWLFVLNHTTRPAALRVAGVELLSGKDVPGELEVAPKGAAVVREHVRGPGCPDGSAEPAGSGRSGDACAEPS
jgi:beta-galactosidase